MQVASRISAMASAGGGGGDDPTVLTFCPLANATVGIYSATAINSSIPIVVDWGDGTIDSVMGNISQLTHTYSNSGTYDVTISDNISSLACSEDTMTFVQTTTRNIYCLKRVKHLSSNVTTLPASAFDSCKSMIAFNAGDSGDLTLGIWAFYQCALNRGFGEVGANSFDFSGRRITTIPDFCFFEATSIPNIKWPQGLTTIGGGAFYKVGSYTSGAQDSWVIPEGVTTVRTPPSGYDYGAFEGCAAMYSLTLPSTLTYMPTQCFGGCKNCRAIYANAMSAPSLGGNAFGTSSRGYTGRNSYSAGTNRLYVPTGATGYTSGQWADPLCDSSKCGFTLEYV